MKKRTGFFKTLGMTTLGLVTTAFLASPAFGSSHREAPGITEMPQVDSTDFYMFKSYETGRSEFVTILANYVPLQLPVGGPNYFPLDELAFYDIHISNDNDPDEELTFRFKFNKELRDLPVNAGGVSQNSSLVNVGPITTAADEASALAPIRTYTLEVLEGKILGKGFPRRGRGRKLQFKGDSVTMSGTGSSTFPMPYDNVGSKSFPDYANYANSFIHAINIPGCDTPGRVFVGQRAEGFNINLGEIFDLVNITNPVGGDDDDQNDVAGINVTTFALEIHQSCLLGDSGTVLGAWTAARLPKTRTLLPAKRRTFDRMYRFSRRNYTQVSRLSMPLVNELVIGIDDKNKFSGLPPAQDLNNFANYVTNPTLPELLEALFPGVLFAPDVFPRTDLVSVFVTGVDGLNVGSGAGEMMRLNTAIAPVAKGAQNNLGVAGGDNAGYPNGRRPGDDTVDITLRVAMGALLPAGDNNKSKAVPLTDGARVDDGDFDDTFPYLRTPTGGSPNMLP